jgi:1,4-alpha-glucan branching enzyme
MNSKGDELVVVCNFQPCEHAEYTFGVPYAGDYEEVFATDDVLFGGDGNLNGTLTAAQVPMHNEPYSLTVKIPAAASLFLKPLREKSVAETTSDKTEN